MEVLTKAANILEISEYDVISRAYLHWHGNEAPIRLIQTTFSTYLKTQELPHWAKHYAMQIIQSFEAELQREGVFFKLLWMLFFNVSIRNKKNRYLIA